EALLTEYDTSDNSFEDCWILLTIPGDINGDQRVNVLDAILIANSFNSKPGDANWNPNADINGDNKVNILDCIVLSNYFGQSWP
ncbi:dockerin type I repeat-containing protein, partial [Candidatus Bathyarchaeota archaeon]|nr:dockerin type I repeat-containing protein [Candidatus Bathyarchaeota archaeon]